MNSVSTIGAVNRKINLIRLSEMLAHNFSNKSDFRGQLQKIPLLIQSATIFPKCFTRIRNYELPDYRFYMSIRYIRSDLGNKKFYGHLGVFLPVSGQVTFSTEDVGFY